jgi:fucose 4-O-acetylase-like acetyltransferase
MGQTQQRDERIDLLRFIGLAMVILAHVYPPMWVAQLRNFDVPLMVLVSALSFSASVKQESYGQYVWARVKRLVFPVWLFLTLYFAVQWAFAYPQALPDFQKILRSYTMIDGIGYVWVIRVFLLVALLAPFIYRFHQRTLQNSQYFRVLLLWYLAYEVAVVMLLPEITGVSRTVLRNTVFDAVPFALLFALGLRIPAMPKAELGRLLGIFTAIFLLFALWFFWQKGSFVRTQLFKYPPQHYYLAYALMCAFALWLMAEPLLKVLRSSRLIGFVLFAGSNSIWIYLWHIFFLQIVEQSWGMKYLLVFACSALLTWLQVTLIQRYWLPRVRDPGVKRNIRALLTG